MFVQIILMSDIHSNSNKETVNEQILVYDNYFKGTIPLKDNYSAKELEIKTNTRVFENKEEEGGYDEIFLNENSEIFGGISNHISFLYPKNDRDFHHRLGFRYYKEAPLLTKNNIPYFTLLRTGINKFIILEKESNIKDINGRSFIIEDLDCLDVVKTILKEKIKKNNDDLTYPNTICELLGFIYASKYRNNSINNIYITSFYSEPSF